MPVTHISCKPIRFIVSGEKSAFSLHFFHVSWRHCARYGWGDGLYLQDAGFVLVMKNCDDYVFTHFAMIVMTLVMTKGKGWGDGLYLQDAGFVFGH